MPIPQLQAPRRTCCRGSRFEESLPKGIAQTRRVMPKRSTTLAAHRMLRDRMRLLARSSTSRGRSNASAHPPGGRSRTWLTRMHQVPSVTRESDAPPHTQMQLPTELPHVSKKNVRLDERQENREQAEFDDVRVPRDLDRLFCSQHAVSVYGLRSRRTVFNGGVKHVPENFSLSRLLFVKIHTGVPGAIQKSKQHQDRSPGEQHTAFPACLLRKFIFKSHPRGAEIGPQPPSFSNDDNDHESSGRVGQNARPADHGRRAVSEANIMDQKNANWQKHTAQQKQLSQQLLATSR